MMSNQKVSIMPGMLSMDIEPGQVWVFQYLESDVRACEVMGGKILFVPGKFMLRNAMKKGKATLDKEGKKILDD